MTIRLVVLTTLALIFFASNSILCRLALGEGTIDPAGFTLVRLFSGAFMLALIALAKKNIRQDVTKNPLAPLFLFAYAICFSFSYIDLSAATGALLLFGTTQVTMYLYALFTGEKFKILSLVGMLIALSGMIYLLLPGINTPPIQAAVLMIIAGAAWGAYTLCGKTVHAPVATTTWNFIATLPLALISLLIFYKQISFTPYGLFLAIASGALASAIGYVIWYSVLPTLSSTTAASAQLSVPVIAAIGGVAFMAETLEGQLLVGSVVTLGGIYLSIRASTR